MSAYDGQKNYGANRNFVSSFPRNSYGTVSEDHSMYMRRPFERGAQMYQRYDDSRTGSYSSPQPSFSRFDEQTRGTRISMDRPMNIANTGNRIANRGPSQNTFTRSEFAGRDFLRPEFGEKSTMFRGSDLNGRSAFPRSDMGNREMFPRSDFTRNGMFSRPQGGSGNMYSRPPADSGSIPSRPMSSGNMFARPQMSSGSGIFSRRPQFDHSSMSGLPMTAPRMQFPYGGGGNQRSSSSLEWNVRPNWRNRNNDSSTATQKRPYAATQQNKPKFKPTKKKLKKRNRIPSKLKDDGKKLKPWMTDELYAEVKKKNEMYFKAKAADSTELWQEFRLQRNKVSSLIKEAKVKGGFLVRKKKEDEDDGKEKPYSCDTCDRAFAEESKLEEHLKEHKKCEIDGCQFEAHPKVVDIHKKLQHDTGYATIISKLGNAAEIEKWRNERKSHFPTLENVKKRQAEQEERFARGEVLETKEFGKFKKRRCEGQPSRSAPNSTGYKSPRGRWGRQRGRIRGSQDRFSHGKLKTVTIQEESISDSDDESHITLPKFPGTSVFTIVNTVHKQNPTILQSAVAGQESDLKCVGSNESITSSVNSQPLDISSEPSAELDFKQKAQLQNLPLLAVEGPTTLSSVNVVSKITQELVSSKEEVHFKENDFSSESNAVSCVLNDQNGNDQESEDEGPAVEPVVKQVETTCQVADFVRECTEEKEQKQSLENSVTKSRAIKNDQTNAEQPSRLNGGFISKKKDTLLEKLLANDIRHERNVILQCIRYTVNNNFFGVAGQRNSRS